MTDTDKSEPWQTQHLALENALLLAHEKDDKCALVDLYTLAADAAEQHNDGLAASFYLTQAYVLALEVGSERHTTLQSRLDVYQQSGFDSEKIS